MDETSLRTQEAEGDDIEPKGMSFLDHLEELRKRLLWSALAIVITTGAAFYFSDQILTYYIKPIGEVKLHVTEVTGSFYAYLKISLLTGLMVSAPIVFYQLWAFISPGLFKHERRTVIPLVMVSTLLFLVGAAFCYFVVLPFSLKFLIGFSGGLLSPIITVGSYISFSGMLLLAFGLGFQIPVVAYFLGRIGVVTSKFLAKGRRYAVVVILIASAILTPTPDAATMLMLASPLYLLYEVSIILVRFTGKWDRKVREEDDDDETDG